MFKELNNKSFGIINLNVEAQKYLQNIEKVDLLDSNFCQKLVENSAKKLGVDFTYGGWLEDRSFLWKGSYLEKTGNFIHLGVDYNVPAGTKVFADYDMEVVHMENDFPLKHGWGRC
jgi:murein DD-endopeptidase MepM/ murein hydrolase activator NlpD